MTQNKPFRVYMLKYMAAPIHITTQWMLSKLLKRKAALIVLIWCIPYKKYVHANLKKRKFKTDQLKLKNYHFKVLKYTT